MKLLLVEDNVESALLLIRVFQSMGYEVVHKTRGFEGLRAAREEKFEAVLLDFNLPDIDGLQVGMLMRTAQRKLPIIALTARADNTTRNGAKLMGFSAFIAKPWSVRELVDTVNGLTHAA
jgi:DNA-binding response OmpR family regulator